MHPKSFFRAIPYLLSGFALLCLGACTHLLDAPPPGAWSAAYQPIHDPASDLFVSNALKRAISEFGDPVFPVRKVMIRRSKKNPSVQNYRLAEDFSLTECSDLSNGCCTIYLGVAPSDSAYFPMLGHECGHLLNPFLFDWYMEGFCTLFSEQFCAEQGKDWHAWRKKMDRKRHDPYAASYQMMRALHTAFPKEYVQLLQFAVSTPGFPGRQHIDIQAWIATLPVAQRPVAREIIRQHTKTLQHYSGAQYHFETVP